LVGPLRASSERAHVGVHRHHLRLGLGAPLLLGHVLVDHLVDRDVGDLPLDACIAALVIAGEDPRRADDKRGKTASAEQQHLLLLDRLVGLDRVAERRGIAISRLGRGTVECLGAFAERVLPVHHWAPFDWMR
jgi:hypothetical protein